MAFDFFGNAADDADEYYKQVPDQMRPYYQPYIDQGQDQFRKTGQQYDRLQQDPSGRLNEIGAGYKQSPGYKFALQQALQGSGHAAAAGGMAGSPEHEQRNMEIASGLASKDYDQWLSHALGLYGEGLHGGQRQGEQGYEAGNEYGRSVAENTYNRGNLHYQKTQQRNKNIGDLVGAGAGTLAAFYGMPGAGDMGAGERAGNAFNNRGGY